MSDERRRGAENTIKDGKRKMKSKTKFMIKLMTGMLATLLLAGCNVPGNVPGPTPTATPVPEPEDEYNNYLFVYFVGESDGGEAIYYAVSQDGYDWTELNKRKSVLQSELGTTGLRDPYIMRSQDGEKFYLIATDLCINKDGDWWKAQTAGSKSVMFWESEDLIHWSEQQMLAINNKTAGCTWAPEAYFDETTGEYMIFWASRTRNDNYAQQRIFYTTTKDFTEFAKPKVWINYPYSTIDTTVIEEDGKYYRFTKYEDKARIIMESADSLLGEWTEVKSATLDDQKGVEGPTCFEFHEEDIVNGQRFALLLDNYGGSGYYMLTTDSLASGEFKRAKGYSLPRRPRHGTVIRISDEEYAALIEKYGTK